jgi:hypothetical protein
MERIQTEDSSRHLQGEEGGIVTTQKNNLKTVFLSFFFFLRYSIDLGSKCTYHLTWMLKYVISGARNVGC